MFLICVPIIIYVIINTLDLNQIKIFGITIPRMISNRYDEASTIFLEIYMKTVLIIY